LSFWIDEIHGGKGYIREAAQTVLHFGFNELQLNRVCAHAMVRNAASERVRLECVKKAVFGKW
jgi:ribosomal-protein-alanine N-acetyltransferase